MEPYEVIAWAVTVFLLMSVVAVILEMGRERCPACGEVLKEVSEVDKYKCLHCGAWYDREDIEVEVVD